MGYKVAVVGATGNVGREMLDILAERNFPADEVVAVASRRSHVYGCLGCSAQCGRCARTIRKIIDETLNGAKVGCPVGCACAMHAADPT